MYPNCIDPVEMIPMPSNLTLAKPGIGDCVSTDNCNSVCKFYRVLIDKVKKISNDREYS